GDDHRPAPKRAALCLAAQHHEGEEEADRRQDARRLRGRCRPPPQDVEGDGTAQARRRRESEKRCRIPGQAQGTGSAVMASLVIAEHDNTSLKDATAKTVTAAVSVSAPVHVLVAGQNCAAVAEAAAKLAGVEKVLLADDARYAHMLAEAM